MEKTYTLNVNQISALHSLLALVHYDDLAREYLKLLPFDFSPNAVGPLGHPTYVDLMKAPVGPPVTVVAQAGSSECGRCPGCASCMG